MAAHSVGEMIEVEVSNPGWLLVQVENEDLRGTVSWIEVVDCPAEARGVPQSHAFLGQALVAVAEPGVVHLRVGTVQLRSETQLRVRTFLFRGEAEPLWIDEALPSLIPFDQGFVQAYVAPSLATRYKANGSGDGTEEYDDEVLPIVDPADPVVFQSQSSSGPPASGVIVCRSGEPYDDFRLCAPRVGADEFVSGRLDHTTTADGQRTLDHDYYALAVDQVESIRLDVEGPDGLAGSLVDSDGRVIAVLIPRAGVLELEVTLVPGRYFVHLAGDSVGEYLGGIYRSAPGEARFIE